MEIVFFQPSLISIIALAVMISGLLIAYFKKIMITYAIIITNLFVFLISLFFSNQLIRELGFRPFYLSFELLPNIYTLFTSMFVHSGFLHILGNMFVFFFMGIAFEQRIGSKKFILIYLITGVCGALTHSLLHIGSSIPLVGASGAVFGILGAFAYSYPRDEVVMPVPIGIMFIMRIKVIYAAIIFATLETLIVIFSVSDNTAHFAHLGGLIGGVVLAAVLLRRKNADTTNYARMRTPREYMDIQESDTINFSHLKQLVRTPEQRKILEHIEQEDVLQVRNIWLDHFLESVICPVCQKPLRYNDRKIWCDADHFQTDF